MPSSLFQWDYTPVFRPFSPLPSHAVAVGLLAEVSRSRSVAFDRWAYQEASTEMATVVAPMFGGDFYNRLHVSTLVLSLGNLVGNQTREITIWNAYRRARILESIQLVDGEGITVSGQPAPPLQFAPLQERKYSIAVSTDGPPTVDAKLIFDMDEGQTITISITGNRVIGWSWPPDWTNGMLEALEWQTDVIETENANEQRFAMRLSPRRTLEFGFGAEAQAKRVMESAAAAWSGRVWVMPFWPDGQDLTIAAPVGSTSLIAKTVGRDFYDGGLAMLLGTTWRDYEVVEILSVSGAGIELKRPTLAPWPVGTRLVPARTARISTEGVTFSRFTGQMNYGRVRFEVVGVSDFPAAAMPTYRGYPVLEDRPEWSADPSVTHNRKLGVIDQGIGVREYVDQGGVPLMRQAHRWSAVGRAQLQRIRSVLYSLQGRAQGVWVPSWADDFVLSALAATGQSSIDVDWLGYTLYVNAARGRRDIRIQNAAGVQYRRISAATELSGDVERLALDAPLSAELVPGLTTVQYLTLWRLDTDRLELAYWSGDMGDDGAVMDVAMPMRNYRNDV